MKKYIIWAALAVLMLTGALVEGLVEGGPQHLVQASGVLTILSALAFTIWAL